MLKINQVAVRPEVLEGRMANYDTASKGGKKIPLLTKGDKGRCDSKPRGLDWFLIALSVCFSLILISPIVCHTAETKTEVKAVDVKLFDLELWDQDGRKVKFKSDVIKDKIVAIVPFYTTCTTAYPILIYIFTRLQEMLGEHLGREVILVSISVDPRTDIPIRLKAYAQRQKAKPGWVFLSGDFNNLATVLSGIGVQYIVGQSLDEHQHIPLTLVGNVRGEWRRFYGYPPPETLLTQINRSRRAKQESERKN